MKREDGGRGRTWVNLRSTVESIRREILEEADVTTVDACAILQEPPLNAAEALRMITTEARVTGVMTRPTRVVCVLELATCAVGDALGALQVVTMVTLDADGGFVDTLQTRRCTGATRAYGGLYKQRKENTL